MTQKTKLETIYTEQQMELLNKMENVCNKAKELEENSKGYVIAGRDENGIDYCYCGVGNGYQGAPLMPACIMAEVVNTEEDAKEIARELTGYRNGAGNEITLYVIGVRYYFSNLRKEMLGSIELAKKMFQETNNNKQ